LIETGNSDAMYLAGLIADPMQISREDLNNWVDKAYWYMLSEYSVAQVAAESPFGQELSLQCINSDKEMVAAAGWATLAGYNSVTDDDRLDFPEIEALPDRIGRELHNAPNRVRYTMNGFIIAAGSYSRRCWIRPVRLPSGSAKSMWTWAALPARFPMLFRT
jgi:hypothetical protein